jgi:hypothetical protein
MAETAALNQEGTNSFVDSLGWTEAGLVKLALT